MNFIRLLPPIMSLLLLSAHFSRADMPLLSLVFLIIPLLLFIKKKWIVRSIQTFLILGVLEWIRSIFFYVNQRQEIGESYVRLVIIIGVVALITGLSALVFKNKKLKELYNIQ